MKAFGWTGRKIGIQFGGGATFTESFCVFVFSAFLALGLRETYEENQSTIAPRAL